MKAIIDVIYIPILIFALLIGLFIVFQIMKSLETPFQNVGINVTSTIIRTTFNYLDYFVLAIFFGLPVFAIILALISGGETILFPIALILLIISVLINSILRDAIVEIIKNLEYIYNWYSKSQITQTLISYYPFIMFVFGMTIIIVQFAFKRA